jgi:hypothetical protein
MQNTDAENSAGGRQSRFIVKGEQDGNEVTTLGYIEFSHEGTGDDENGQLRIYLNAGSDGDTPTLAATIGSDGAVTLPGNVAIAGTLDVTDDVDVNSNFTVDASSGDTVISGTLAASGNTTIGQLQTMLAVKRATAAISAGGAITVATTFVSVTGAGDAADNLDTITSGSHPIGTIVILENGNSDPATEAITVRDNGASGDNIHLGADTRVLDNVNEKLTLIKRGADSWNELVFSDNGP